MTHLRWEEVQNFFDPDLMGALPDLWIPDSTVEDWQSVFDLVQSSEWTWTFLIGGRAQPLPRAADVLSRPADAELADLHVDPAVGVRVIFRPMQSVEVNFDVDLRELQGQQGVDTLSAFLCTLGRRLAKPVLMGDEGGWGRNQPVLGFDPAADNVVLLADPRLP
ncbi:hypothetical protein ACIA49_37720 [Kribbella sp. NPDC051587]|uniref:hypothetical protein n=1 Tax=Kribbella sp. NPDC051587 TaxID=3364119 RepID=UPI0037BCB1D8